MEELADRLINTDNQDTILTQKSCEKPNQSLILDTFN